MEAALDNLLKDGKVAPTAFLFFADKSATVQALRKFPSDSNQRANYMYGLGKLFREEYHKTIKIAYMVLEGWMAPSLKVGSKFTRPSQHPKRKECIFLMGRNSGNSRQTSVIRTFEKSGGKYTVELIPKMKDMYNHDTSDGLKFQGLLDHLFEGNRL